MKKKKWLIIGIIVIVIGIAGAAGGSSSSKDNKKENKTEQVEKKEDYSLVGKVKSSTDKLGYLTLEGTIKNNTNKKASYVQVEFNIYDKDGNQIGTALDNVNNLEAGGTWKFKAMALEKGADTYKLAEISGW